MGSQKQPMLLEHNAVLLWNTQPLISSIKKGGGKKATQHLQSKTSQNEPFRTGTVAGLLSNLHHINILTVPHGLYYFGSHRQQTSAWFPIEEPP